MVPAASPEAAPRRLSWALAVLSAGLLAQEVLLTRLFSIVQWHHFAYLVISLALLGYGASGTLMALTRRWLSRFEAVYVAFSLAFAVTSVIAFDLAQRVPFNPFEIVWDRRQPLYLLAVYLLLMVPFLCGGTCIGLALARFAEQAPRLYFADLLGAGGGAVLSVAVLFLLQPQQSLLAVAACGFLSALLLAGGRLPRLLIATAAVVYLTFYGAVHPLTLAISPYKSLPATLLLPEARIVRQRFGPLGLLHVVASPVIRHAPGLSLNYFGELPPQQALFADGDSLSAIAFWGRDLRRLEYLDQISSALPYHLRRPSRVLVLGAGGGADVLQALYHRPQRVDAVELNPQVVELARTVQHLPPSSSPYDPYGDFDVRVHLTEARGFLEATRERYDLIQLALLDSFSASAAGVYALSESYLYTVEALRLALQRLTPSGLLCITRWLKFPPRDEIKLFATAVAALEAEGISQPGRHLILVRSWKTATLVVSRSPLEPAESDAALTFCDQRSFDVSYRPGMGKTEPNRYNFIEGEPYHRAAQAILFGDREQFFRESLFDLRPATDDRPYFLHFFRWRSLPRLREQLGREWAQYAEWGYLVLVAALAQALLASMVLILLPLLFRSTDGVVGRRCPDSRFLAPGSRFRVLVYFTALGLAFFFLEIAFIQKFVLYLGHPLYAVAVVLAGFLVFAGLGSRGSATLEKGEGRREHDIGFHRLGRRDPIVLAVAGIVLTALLYLALLPAVFHGTRLLPPAFRILLSLVLIAPLAVCMGMPFPLGLRRLAATAPGLVPWAWAINGCASVVSAVLATLLAIHLGFRWVVVIALGLYGVAAVSRVHRMET